MGVIIEARERNTTGARFRAAKARMPDMFIGADFLKANRVFVANSQSRFYMTWLGGRIFWVDEMAETASSE